MTPAQIIAQRCCELTGVHPRDLAGRYRFAFISEARFALYKALHLRGWSYSKIGRELDRDRTSVRNGVDRANYMMVRDKTFKGIVHTLATMPLNPTPEKEPSHEDV